MEGSILASLQDQSQHSFQIVEHISSGNPQRLEAEFSEQFIAPAVPLRNVSHRMPIPIDLDRKPMFQACKIKNTPAMRILTAKSEAAGPLLQLLPKQDFRQGHLPAQFAGEPHIAWVSSDCAVPDLR